MIPVFIILSFINQVSSDLSPEDLSVLNELPLQKLVSLRNSLEGLVTTKYDNSTIPAPSYLQQFGAQALAMKGPIKKRTDYEDVIFKKDAHTKISSIFSMSVTTLAFLAFGGYLLCLIVQAVKSKQGFDAGGTQSTVLFSSGIKKKPLSQLTSYGRRRRENKRYSRSISAKLKLPPDELFSTFLRLCEAYVKWSGDNGGA